MLEEGSVRSTDPEGERFLRALPWPVDTPGGRYFAEFDDEAPVTREGQLLFFAQFLHAGGRWERFVSNTPLHYVGLAVFAGNLLMKPATTPVPRRFGFRSVLIANGLL